MNCEVEMTKYAIIIPDGAADEAIEALKSRLTTVMTPRDITMKMTRALGRAHRGNKPIITSDCVV